MENETDTTVEAEVELNLDETQETTEKPVETPEAKLARLERQAKQLRNKLGLQEPKQEKNINNNPKPLDILRDDAFKLYREGYTEDEIDIILQNGGRKVLDNQSHPLTLGLKAAKEQREAERAANAATGGSGFSDVNEKVSTEQLKNMTSKEMEKILPHAQS